MTFRQDRRRWMDAVRRFKQAHKDGDRRAANAIITELRPWLQFVRANSKTYYWFMTWHFNWNKLIKGTFWAINPFFWIQLLFGVIVLLARVVMEVFSWVHDHTVYPINSWFDDKLEAWLHPPTKWKDEEDV